MSIHATADAAEADLTRHWLIGRRVAVREEPFGALLYHYDNRRLSFVTSTTLLDVLRDERRCAADVLEAAGIPHEEWHLHLASLRQLAAADMVRVVDPQKDDSA